MQKEIINLKPNDTLFVKFRYNEYYTKNINDNESFRFVQDSANIQMIYSNNVSIEVLPTDEKSPFIQIEKIARGKSFQDAKQRAEKIKYAVKINGNELILDNYLLSEVGNKFRDQEVEIFLYLPKGVLLKPDATVQNYDRSDDSFFNIHHSSDNYIYRVGDSQIKCLNCPANENEYDDVIINDNGVELNLTEGTIENDSVMTTTVQVHGETVRVRETGSKKGLSISKNGIIIKN